MASGTAPVRHNRKMAKLATGATLTRIGTLTDRQAVQALALVVAHEHPTPDADATCTDGQLREALDDPALQDFAPTTLTPSDEGTLARAALIYAITSNPALADVVDEAMILASGPGDRFEPTTVAIGGLVLVVLKTEVKLERKPGGRWHLLLHVKPVADSTLGKVITALIAHFTDHGD